MDTPDMNHSFWVKPPHIPVTIPERRPKGGRPRDTQSPVLTMRVWVALPKKAALYTMKTSSEQCLTLPVPALGLGSGRPHFGAYARHHQDPGRAAKNACRGSACRRGTRHDRRVRGAG